MRSVVVSSLLWTGLVSLSARAQNTAAPRDAASPQPAATASVEAPPPSPPSGWEISFSGYFRAPLMIGLSVRPDPGEISNAGPEHTQLVFLPNRLLDANYNRFSYTRLAEGDWGEVYVSAKRPHVAATIAFMGYWLAWAGYELPSASWVPAQAWVTLDSDLNLGAFRPHVELKGGVFWQRWGMFEKYDTYMFGRFHQAGEALELQLPLAADATLRLVHGFGANRNGSATSGTGLTLLHYAHAGLGIGAAFDLGLYYNDSWTRDPSLFAGDMPAGGGDYADARHARMTVVGADVTLRLPVLGQLWLAASHVQLEQGWALSQTVELLHSPGGSGIATNYLAFGEPGSTGSGSLSSVAWLYENSLSNLQGRAAQHPLPDLTLNLFGMGVRAKRELLAGATVSESLQQLKWGADLTLTALPWLAFMLRYDRVSLDTSDVGQRFSVITPRVTFFSHFLSKEAIWLQYSHYEYGENLSLPTGPTQPYAAPDGDVVKLQASVAF